MKFSPFSGNMTISVYCIQILSIIYVTWKYIEIFEYEIKYSLENDSTTIHQLSYPTCLISEYILHKINCRTKNYSMRCILTVRSYWFQMLSTGWIWWINQSIAKLRKSHSRHLYIICIPRRGIELWQQSSNLLDILWSLHIQFRNVHKDVVWPYNAV